MPRTLAAAWRPPLLGCGLVAPSATGLLAAVLLLAGCAGYRVGTESLYAPDVHTVYVPVFESVSFRRNLGERLTEAVVKEIELKTPYKVVGRLPADTTLSGRIVQDTKRAVIPGPSGGPREAEFRLTVEVAWIDNRGNTIRQSDPIALAPALQSISDFADVIPEYGQSVATGQQQAIQRAAEQIVGMMEAPW
jgi:hypothetical protein